jgi:hypothetical protein
LISSVVLISKFAQSAISKSCELRNHDTSVASCVKEVGWKMTR